MRIVLAYFGGNQKSGDTVCCRQHPLRESAALVIMSKLPLPPHPFHSDFVSGDTKSSPYKKSPCSQKSSKKPLSEWEQSLRMVF
jgi:hypothetical protein